LEVLHCIQPKNRKPAENEAHPTSARAAEHRAVTPSISAARRIVHDGFGVLSTARETVIHGRSRRAALVDPPFDFRQPDALEVDVEPRARPDGMPQLSLASIVDSSQARVRAKERWNNRRPGQKKRARSAAENSVNPHVHDTGW